MCTLSVIKFPVAVLSLMCSFSPDAPYRVESRAQMSRARGSAQDVCIFLQCPSVRVLSHTDRPCRVQLYLQLLVCRIQQSVRTPLHKSEDRAGLPVSFPEGMVSGRLRSGLRMPIFFVERALQNITVWVGVPLYGGSCVYGVCVRVCVAGLVRPCIMPWFSQ